jgi:hypothetical protein
LLDPCTSLDRIPTDDTRRVFVIGDPRETDVPFSTHKHDFEGLVARGHAAWLLALERAPRRASTMDFGETATTLCATGASADTIIAKLRAMVGQLPRRTNRFAAGDLRH